MTRHAAGFSLVELALVLCIVMAVTSTALVVVAPGQGIASSRTEAADMQQRLRVATDAIQQHLIGAGAAAYTSGALGPLRTSTPPIVPYRFGGTAPGPPGSFTTDVITIFAVARSGTEPVGTTFWLKTDEATATYQLMSNDTTSNLDVPVVDNVVGLGFEYFGEPQPPRMRKPLADPVGPWTTYGPSPPVVAVAPFGPGENCVFVDDGSGTPQPRLAVLGAADGPLVRLTSSQLGDGPWCPDAGAAGRWDADLLRVRRVVVTVRVQATAATLRGPAGALFAHGGTSRGGHQWVPDLEARFQVTPRNLNASR